MSFPLACPHCGEALLFDGPTTSPDGHTRLDADGMLTTPAGRRVKLSPQQAGVVRLLLLGFGRPVRKSAVFDALNGARPDSDWPDPHSLDTVVCHVRRKLEGTGLRIRTAGWGLWVLEEGERAAGPRHWTPADDEAIRRWWGRRPVAEIAAAIGLDASNRDACIRLRARCLGLPPLGRRRRRRG
jgi:hypothetical protein